MQFLFALVNVCPVHLSNDGLTALARKCSEHTFNPNMGSIPALTVYPSAAQGTMSVPTFGDVYPGVRCVTIACEGQ